jgi:acyl transferase domain-containing protein
MRAAAARGTEMGSVDVPDPGLMAAVGAPADRVIEAISQIDGYVIAANRNSPNSTVIAGETEAVRLAMKYYLMLEQQSSRYRPVMRSTQR